MKVATINSTTPAAVRTAVLADLQSGHPYTRLLYVTPEYCAMDHFRRVLRTIHLQGELSRIAVDEAHCISEWGHDFRPSFKDLCFFKREFPDVPMICLTATATQRVREDIITTLGLNPHNMKLFTMTTSRPNLHYEVRFKCDDVDQYDDFIEWIRNVRARRREANRSGGGMLSGPRSEGVSGIIYTLYRRDCEALAARLNSDGIGAKPFHAGLSNDEKDDHLKGWVESRPGYDVIVATTAFGMGIDKDNVRFVAHWQIPKSFEGFYQEAGRAGRDGKASLCIMYYGREDRDRALNILARDIEKQANKQAKQNNRTTTSNPQASGRTKSLQALIAYCENASTCRHKLICQYFGEATVPECDIACDACKDKASEGAIGGKYLGGSIARRKDRGLASEEWCSTQRETGGYGDGEYD